MSWKYRYRRDYVADYDLVDFCNAVGAEGWSLVGAPVWVPDDLDHDSMGVWRLFFKRTISNREQLKEVFALTPQEAEP